MTKVHFYKAYGTLPTKTPTDFELYVTAAQLAVYKLVTGLQSFTLMMASAQVVETSVNTNNSPSQDYTTNPDDHSNHNIDSPGFRPFTVIRKLSLQIITLHPPPLPDCIFSKMNTRLKKRNIPNSPLGLMPSNCCKYRSTKIETA